MTWSGQAVDGAQAVEMARELNPDIVVMDIKMPVMDGLTAAEIVGREGIAAVVMLTAFSDQRLVERAREAGVMAYVVKPFAAHDVLPALEMAAGRWSERVALEAEVSDLAGRLETRKRLDRAKGLLMEKLEAQRGGGLSLDSEGGDGPAYVHARGRRRRGLRNGHPANASAPLILARRAIPHPDLRPRALVPIFASAHKYSFEADTPQEIFAIAQQYGLSDRAAV